MASKFYAIRRGTQTGVFKDWDTCKDYVIGYPGAEYKSFSTEIAAQNYLEGTDMDVVCDNAVSVIPKPTEKTSCNLYSWSSYNDNGNLEFSVVIETSKSHINRFHGYTFPRDNVMSNSSSARTVGIIIGLYICYQLGYSDIKIVCNDVCLEKWATGEYTAKGLMQAKYVSLLADIVKAGLKVDFIVCKKCSFLNTAKKLAKSGYLSGNYVEFLELINNEFSYTSLCVR